MKKCSPVKNKSNGPEGEKAEKLRKKATSSSRGTKQPKGSSEHNTETRYAKPQKNLKNSTMF